MAKNENQKQKLLYLCKLFLEETDENHPVTIRDMATYLEHYGIRSERKSLYDDIDCLIDFGFDIAKDKGGRSTNYYLASRDFEQAELKLLVDSVQTARFISAKKSSELIGKLEKLASKDQAKALQRQVYVAGRVKTENKKLYYSVNEIHNAINSNRQIRFHYNSWTPEGKLSAKGSGWYQVSPWALIVDEGNYYLVAYDNVAQLMKHYRVDKITESQMMDEVRVGKEVFERIDVSTYEKEHFGMFHGDETMVKILVSNSKIGIFFDRFGTDIRPVRKDDHYSTITVKVRMSDNFLGWVMGLGDDVEIIGPEETRKIAKEFVERIASKYLN